MALTTWLRWLKGGRGLAGRIRSQSPSTVRAPRQHFVPRLDVLEDRTLPSTFTVMNLHDSGPGSLRAAIAAANANPGPDQIKFADGVTGTSPLTSGQLDISGDLAIHGPGADELTVSGNNASRVFAIASGVTVTLSDLTIAQGKAVTGGGIDNAGILTLRDSTVASNQAVGGAGGGGILNEAGAQLTVQSSTLIHNQAIAASATVDVFGGGLLNEGSATILATCFTDNSALGGGGSSFFGGSVGGG